MDWESPIRIKISHRTLGLTIAEILIAVGLLAIVLVTVMTLFGQLIKNTNKNSLLSAGSFFADKVIETQVSQAQSNLLNMSQQAFNFGGYVKVGDKYGIEGEDSVTIGHKSEEGTNSEDRATKYLYRVEAQRLDANTGDNFGQLWFVEVEVRWWQSTMDGTSQVRAGQGELNLKRGRLAYLGVKQ